MVDSLESELTLKELIAEKTATLHALIKRDIKESKGRFEKGFFKSELSLGRKNMTHNFIKLLRLAIKMMRLEEGDSTALKSFNTDLSRAKVNVRSITNLFR